MMLPPIQPNQNVNSSPNIFLVVCIIAGIIVVLTIAVLIISDINNRKNKTPLP